MAESITINSLDPATFAALEDEARRRGLAVADVARELLSQALSPTHQPAPAAEGGPWHDLDPLAGTWSDADAREFADATADFNRVDLRLWE